MALGLLLASRALPSRADGGLAVEPERRARAPGETSRASSHRLEWRWRRWGALDYAATTALVAGYLSVEFGMHPPAEARWRGGILFDSAVRRAVRAATRRSRDRWAVAGDVLALAPQAMMVVDSLLVPLLGDDGNTEVAWQLSVIAAQSEALTGLLVRAGHFGIARERPDAVPCRRDASYSSGCFRGTTAGFPGGHVAGGMVGAGVVCVHHQHLPLYGGGFWDAAACGFAVGLGLASGYSRMPAERHYLSDTLAGIAIGAGAGYLLPLWLHYRGAASDRPERGGAGSLESTLRWTIAGLPQRDATGLSVSGWF